MKFFDPNNPNEKKKMIAAGALGLVALIVLGYVFFGGASSKPPTNRVAGGATPTPRNGIAGPQQTPEVPDDSSIYQPINYPVSIPPASDANRNIFAYYEA